MDAARIDEAIQAVVGDRWKKVAMVIAKVSDAMSTELPTGEERFEAIPNRRVAHPSSWLGFPIPKLWVPRPCAFRKAGTMQPIP